MRAPVDPRRHDGEGDSRLERALGQLLSFVVVPRLAGEVVHVELAGPRGPDTTGSGNTDRSLESAQVAEQDVSSPPLGAPGSAPPLPPTTPDSSGSGPAAEPTEVRLRAALVELGLDEASVTLLHSAATTLAAVHAGRPLIELPPPRTTRANRPARGHDQDDSDDNDSEHEKDKTDDKDHDAEGRIRAKGNDGGETGVGAPDARTLQESARRVLDRVEDLLDLTARLEGALLRAAGQLTTANARLLLAQKGRTDPTGLAPTARARWAARSRSVTAHELAAATGWGIGEARDLVALSTSPAQITIPAAAALAAGRVSWRLVRRAWRAAGTAGLDVAATSHLAQVMLGTDPDLVAVERLTPDGAVTTLPWAHGQFHHALDREIAKLLTADPDTARTARAHARAARDTRAQVNDDGTATLTITSTPAQATAIIDRLHAAARAARRHGDTRTLAQLRADTAAALLLHATVDLPDLPDDPDLVTVEHVTALAAVLEGLPSGTLNVILPWHLLHPTHPEHLHQHPHRCTTATCPAGPPPATGARADAGARHGAGSYRRREHQDPASGRAVTLSDHPPGTPENAAGTGSGHPPRTPGDAAGRGSPEHPGVAFGTAVASGSTPTFLDTADIAGLVLTPGTTLHRLVVDPLDGRCVERSTTAYQPDAHMRAQATAADGTCRAPGCTRPAIYTQLDHVHEHADGGATALCNLECLCTTHHDLKTARHWAATIDNHRTVTWTTLLGRIYATRVHDHRAYLTLIDAATTTVDQAVTTATVDGNDPRAARAEAIDQVIYTALCHRAPTDLLPTAEDDLTPYDNPHHRGHTRDQGGDVGTSQSTSLDRAFTGDPATTLTHTDPQGHRRWGPPAPTTTDRTSGPVQTPTPLPTGCPGTTPVPAPDHDSPGGGHAGRHAGHHGDRPTDDPEDGGTPWGNRTWGPPPF